MSNILSLKKRVMARIYLEYTKNLVVRHPDYFMMALFITASSLLVSFHNVLMNTPKDNLPNFLNFVMVALHNTHWLLQIFIAGFFIRAIVSGAMLVRKNWSDKWSLAKFNVFKY